MQFLKKQIKIRDRKKKLIRLKKLGRRGGEYQLTNGK
jgi:hypothetical protein